MRNIKKIVVAYLLIMAVFTGYVIADTFFITRVYGEQDSVTGQDSGLSADENSGSEQQAIQGESDTDSTNDANDADDPASEGTDGRSADGSSGEHSGKGPGGSGKHGGPGGKKHSRSDSSDNSDSSDSSSGSSNSSGSSDSSSGNNSGSSSSSGSTVSTDNYTITLTEYNEYNSTIYVADVQVSSPEYLKTALAQRTYGRNVTQKTSEIAESVNAVLAINGDYYGAQTKGYVIRNGKLYRDTAIAGQEDLVIYKDGTFAIINESDVTAQELINNGAVQVLSFGPGLVQNGNVTVSENEEVGKAMASNPRTAIGIIDQNHYIFVVSDGRNGESEGLSLYELAQFMKSQGATTAYNLDGGGSSTMYFNGNVVNNPTTGGNTIKERSVSDIVYIG